MPFCNTCGRHYFSDRFAQPHTCPPVHRVLSEWAAEGLDLTDPAAWEGDADRVRADSAEDAARLWAEKYDRGDGSYPIAHGEYGPAVFVRSPRGDVTAWDVTGELQPTYTATAAPERIGQHAEGAR